jgi:ABC-type lipoprotein release transport system permease subunit
VLARLALRVAFGVDLNPFELVAIALAPIPLIVAAFLACKLPARRAAHIDPKLALRHL